MLPHFRAKMGGNLWEIFQKAHMGHNPAGGKRPILPMLFA
jgi:hypothetical protein